MKRAFSEIRTIDSIIKQNEKISYEDFLELCNEDVWAEWLDGEIVMVSPASKQHQRIGSFLEKILSLYIESRNLGEVFRAPFQMRLESSGREPDLIYISSRNMERLKDVYLDGPADMVVEIISDESRRRDQKEKFREYEIAGVKEYWLIDPIRKQAEFYQIGSDGHYYSVPADAGNIYHSEAVPGFWLKVSWLWQEPLPSVWDILREMNLL